MTKVELTERLTELTESLAGDVGMSKEAAAASRRQGRKRWQKPVSNQMQMKGEESRPSGG